MFPVRGKITKDMQSQKVQFSPSLSFFVVKACHYKGFYHLWQTLLKGNPIQKRRFMHRGWHDEIIHLTTSFPPPLCAGGTKKIWQLLKLLFSLMDNPKKFICHSQKYVATRTKIVLSLLGWSALKPSSTVARSHATLITVVITDLSY